MSQPSSLKVIQFFNHDTPAVTQQTPREIMRAFSVPVPWSRRQSTVQSPRAEEHKVTAKVEEVVVQEAKEELDPRAKLIEEIRSLQAAVAEAKELKAVSESMLERLRRQNVELE